MHLSAGQEPVAAGVCAHLTADDAVTATHRPHHFAIAHGVDLERMAAEIFGRETGLGRGRGGHMHLFDPDTHFSCSGIIAEGYPAGARAGVRVPDAAGTDRIAVAVDRRGRGQPGRLPRVAQPGRTVAAAGGVRRRGQRLGHLRTPQRVHRASTSNAVRAAGYGMPGKRVEDNSVEAVYEAAGRGGRPGPRRVRGRVSSRCTHCGCGATSRATPRPTGPTWRECRGGIRSPTYERALRTAGVLDDDARRRSVDGEAAARVEAAIAFAKRQPGTQRRRSALEHVFA